MRGGLFGGFGGRKGGDVFFLDLTESVQFHLRVQIIVVALIQKDHQDNKEKRITNEPGGGTIRRQFPSERTFRGSMGLWKDHDYWQQQQLDGAIVIRIACVYVCGVSCVVAEYGIVLDAERTRSSHELETWKRNRFRFMTRLLFRFIDDSIL